MDSIAPTSDGYRQPDPSDKEDSFQLEMVKRQGEENFEFAMEMSSAQAGLTALMIIIVKYAKVTGLTLYRVLSMLTVSLLRPQDLEEEKPHD
ncbi:MAG: hypothetical protein IKG87_02775 [Clostridia bacterium]|nr:hypothetical protein [Clostridia bacterium]